MSMLHNAKALRRTQTDAEQKLWYHLRAHRFKGRKLKRQKPIGRYVVDFICSEEKLIIELDGGQHSESVEYDHVRDSWLRSEGCTVLRFWNNELICEMEGVLERIRVALSNEAVSSETLSPGPSPAKIPSPQSSDTTTSHSTRPLQNSDQVAGYPASVRGGKREKQSSIFVRREKA